MNILKIITLALLVIFSPLKAVIETIAVVTAAKTVAHSLATLGTLSNSSLAIAGAKVLAKTFTTTTNASKAFIGAHHTSFLNPSQWLKWTAHDWTKQLAKTLRISTDCKTWSSSVQGEVITNFANYQSPGYIDLIKQLPNVRDHIFNLYKQFKDPTQQQALFNKIYETCNHADVQFIQQQVEEIARPYMIDPVTRQFDPSIPYGNYYHLDANQFHSYIEPKLQSCTIVVQQSPNLARVEHAQPLIPALQEGIATHYNSQAILEQTGSLPEGVITIEQMHVNLETSEIKQVVTTQAQSYDFKMLKSKLSGDAAGRLFYELFATINTLSVEHCNKGYLAKGLILNDLAFEICQFATGIGKGIYSGAKQAVITAAQNPMRTACWVLAPEQMMAAEIGYQLGKALYYVGGLAKTALIDPRSIPAQLKASWNNLPSISKLHTLLSDHLAELKQLSRHELAEKSTEFITSYALSKKLCKGVDAFAYKAKDLAYKSAVKFTHPKAQAFNAKVNQIAQSAQDKLKQLTQEVVRPIKVNNMAEFFRDTEFGRELKNKVIKTGEIYDGQTIYQVKEKIKKYDLKAGDLLYLDGLHKDHLEVFRNNESVNILNINGSINESKKLKARGRILKI